MPRIKLTSMDQGDGSFYPKEGALVNINGSGDALHKALKSLDSIIGYDINDHRSGANHIRWYCNLAKPVLNMVLAGNCGSRLCSLLDIDGRDMNNICDFSHVYDKNTGKIIPTEVAASEGNANILIGGEYIEFLIDNVDILGKIRPNLLESLKKAVNQLKCLDSVDPTLLIPTATGKKKKLDLRKISIARTNGAGNFCYGINIDLGTTDAKLTEDIFNTTAKILLSQSSMKYALYLNSLPRDAAVNKLKGMLFKHLLIPPINMRPSYMRANDQLENSYVTCYLANLNLESCKLTGESVGRHVELYKRLWTSVTEYTYKARQVGHQSVLEKLATKHGQIRSGNLSKRSDYSARTVITVDPKLPIDTVGLPRRVAHDVLKHAAMEQGTKSALSAKFTPKNVCNDSELFNRNDPTPSYINSYLDQKDLFLTIGRQPTLHKGSITSYKFKIVDGESLKLPALICPAFNADFDGDTMWSAIPTTKAAKVEAATLLYGPNNMFWAKDGAPTITPRQEMIYGLNQCTLLSYPNSNPHEVDCAGHVLRSPRFVGVFTSPKEAYNAVIYNKLRVYDKTRYNGVDMTVGQLAFRHCLEGANIHFGVSSFTEGVYVCPVCGNTYSFTEYGGKSTRYCKRHHVELVREDDISVKNCACCSSRHTMESIIDLKDDEIKVPYGFELRDKLKDLKNAFNLDNRYSSANAVFSTTRKDIHLLYELMEAIAVICEYPGLFDRLKEYVTRTSDISSLPCESITIDSNTPIAKRAEYEQQNCIIDALKTLKAINDNNFMTYISVSKAIPQIDGITRADINSIGYTNGSVTIACTNPLIDIYKQCCDSFGAYIKEYYAARQKAYTKVKINNMSIADTMAKLDTCPKCGFSQIGVTVTKDNISFFVKQLLIASGEPGAPANNELFVRDVHRLTQLGFAVAKHYAPTLNVLEEVDLSEPTKTFRRKIERMQEFYNYGYVSETEYADNYAEALKKRGDETLKELSRVLAKHNGFYKMIVSGARGSKDNLRQMYGFKGQVRKSETEMCNAVIEHSYIQQLTPLEHFNAANGSRSGIMDRSLSTADTGYTSRQMWHATNGIVITSEDCGATQSDCVQITRSTISDAGSSDVDAILVDFYTGRYCFVDGKEELVSHTRAKELVATNTNVYMRSPLTCKDPLCAKCYGIDLSTWNKVVVGTPVGIMAAEAIGETTSQLVMRTFQNGGVAKKGGIGSAYAQMQAYVNVSDIKDFEPVAWETGDITVDKNGVATIVNENGKHPCPLKKFRITADVQLKARVQKGEGIFVTPADRNIHNMLQYSNLLSTKLFMALKLHSIYKSECNISLKHFEVLVESMCRGHVLRSNSHLFKVGCYYTRKQLRNSGIPDECVNWTILPISSIPLKENDCVANIDFEDIAQGMYNSVMLDNESTFENPMEALAFGLRPKVGMEINQNYYYERTGYGNQSGARYNNPRGDMLH